MINSLSINIKFMSEKFSCSSKKKKMLKVTAFTGWDDER
jgi:hypothetical protein